MFFDHPFVSDSESEGDLSFQISAMTGDESSEDEESEVDRIFNEALQDTNRSLTRKIASPGDVVSRTASHNEAKNVSQARYLTEKGEDESIHGSISVKIPATVPAHTIISPVVGGPPDSPASSSISASSAMKSSLVDNTRFGFGSGTAMPKARDERGSTNFRLPEIQVRNVVSGIEEEASAGDHRAKGGVGFVEHQHAADPQGKSKQGTAERGRDGSPFETSSVHGRVTAGGHLARSKSPSGGSQRDRDLYRSDEFQNIKGSAVRSSAENVQRAEEYKSGLQAMEEERRRALQRLDDMEREREAEREHLTEIIKERDKLGRRVGELEELLDFAKSQAAQSPSREVIVRRVREELSRERERDKEAIARVERERERQHEEEMAQLKEERDRNREELARMGRDRERDREAVAEMEVERDREREELTKVIMERDALSVRVVELEDAVESLHAHTQAGIPPGGAPEVVQDLERLWRDNAQLQRRAAEAEEQNGQLEQSNTEHRAKIRQLLIELKEAEQALAKKESDYQHLEEKAQSANNNLEQTEADLRSRVHQAAQEHGMLIKRASDAELLAEQLTVRLEAVERTVQSALNERDAMMREMRSLEEKLAKRGGQAKIEALERDLSEAMLIQEDLRARLKGAGKATEEMRLELNTQKSHADERHSLCVQQRSQISALEAQLEASISEVEMLRRRISQGEKSSAELDADLQTWQEKSVKLQEAVRMLEDHNEALQEQVRTTKEINAEKRKEVTEAVGEIERLRGELAHRDRDGRALSVENAALRQEVERLRASLSEASSNSVNNKHAIQQQDYELQQQQNLMKMPSGPPLKQPPLPLHPQLQNSQHSPPRAGAWDADGTPDMPRFSTVQRHYNNAHHVDALRYSADSSGQPNEPNNTRPSTARMSTKQEAADARALELARAIQANQHEKEQAFAKFAAKRSTTGGSAPFAEGGTFNQVHESRKPFSNQMRPEGQQVQTKRQLQMPDQQQQQQQPQQAQVVEQDTYTSHRKETQYLVLHNTAEQRRSIDSVYQENGGNIVEAMDAFGQEDTTNKLPSAMREVHEANTRALQRKLVALNQEKQMMESEFTRLMSKGALKTAEDKRSKLELERALEKIGKDIASLRREVRSMEGNSLNPKKSAQFYAVLDR